MVYVSVAEDSKDRLRLCRDPSVRSWAISIGLISLGIGSAIYSADCLLWKIACVSCATFVAISFMEEWEECLFDKSSGKVHFRAETLMGRLLQVPGGLRSVSGDIEDIVDVKIEAEDVKYGKTVYTVVLKFSPGYSIGVTETATSDNKSDHQQIVDKITQFLELDKRPSSSNIQMTKEELENSTETEEVSEGEKTADESAHSDESFERIDKADIPDDLSTSDPQEDGANPPPAIE